MPNNLDEEVQRLCREIPEEKDPERMMELVKRLNQLLDAQEARKHLPTHAHVSPDICAGAEGGPDSTDPTPQFDPRERKSA